jgi:hypothetical protein
VVSFSLFLSFGEAKERKDVFYENKKASSIYEEAFL